MLKIPSINTLWASLRNILIRFPMQSLIALIAMSLWLSVADNYAQDNRAMIHKFIALSAVAFTSSLSLALFAERSSLNIWRSLGIQLLMILTSYSIAFFIYPEYFRTDVLKIILLILAGHLMVSFTAYLNRPNLLIFWNFNKILFLRFFTSVLFSAILYIGLAIALFTTEALFDIDLKGNTYLKLFIIIAVGFNTLFFLDGIPTNLTELPKQNDYPKALKIFTQYVLIPLLTIYLAILLVYELKIAFSMELPDGMVSILIMGYAVFGILSYLLIYPISKDSQQGWINQFSKLFFWFMLPLLILLFAAILVRIQEYGITEMRYFVFVLALWLACITLYFIIKKEPNIKIIPISLFFATILTIAGPQSASSISRKSQQSRLVHYIKSDDQTEENISIIKYLVRYHGLTALESFTPENVFGIQEQVINTKDTLINSTIQKQTVLLDTAFSILAIDRYPFKRSNISFSNQENYIRDNNFDIVFWMNNQTNREGIHTPAGNVTTSYPNSQAFYVIFNETDSFLFDMDDFRKSLILRYDSLKTDQEEKVNQTRQIDEIDAPRDWMILNAENAEYHVQLQIQKITIDNKNDTEKQTYFPYFSAYILIDEK